MTTPNDPQSLSQRVECQRPAGKLVDADALKAKIDIESNLYSKTSQDVFYQICKLIDSAPAVAADETLREVNAKLVAELECCKSILQSTEVMSSEADEEGQISQQIKDIDTVIALAASVVAAPASAGKEGTGE